MKNEIKEKKVQIAHMILAQIHRLKLWLCRLAEQEELQGHFENFHL